MSLMHWTLRIWLCPTVFNRFHGVISLQGSGSCSDLLNTQVWRPPALATGRPSVPPLSNFQWDPPAPAAFGKWNKTKIAHCNIGMAKKEVQSMIPLCSPVMPSCSDLPACLCELVISCVLSVLTPRFAPSAEWALAWVNYVEPGGASRTQMVHCLQSKVNIHITNH